MRHNRQRENTKGEDYNMCLLYENRTRGHRETIRSEEHKNVLLDLHRVTRLLGSRLDNQ